MESVNIDLGPLGQSKPGQKECKKCLKRYNNRAIPEFCDQCDNYLGGNFRKKDTISNDAQLITPSLASVRTNQAGVPTRTFVDVSLNKVAENIV